MRCIPACPASNINRQGDINFYRWLCRIGHDLPDNFGRFGDIALGQFEHQFIMHLQQHADVAQTGFGQCGKHPRHRSFDNICAGPLNRGIDRRPLAALTLALILGIDPREPGFAPKQCLGITAFAHGLQRFHDVALNAGKALEIGVDHRLSLIRFNFQPAGQPPARDAVKNGEVDGFGLGPCVTADLSKHFRCRAGMDVLARGKGLLQGRHVRHMCGQPKLDLGIVRREQHIAILWHKCLADLPTDGCADRDVLQVRIGRR